MAAGLALIRRSEVFHAPPYRCPAGYWTYGFGAIWDVEGNRVTGLTPPIDETQGEELLTRDCGLAERAVFRLIRVVLTDGQFDALVSFTFNLGGGALQRSTLRQKVNREEHDEVPAEFLRWVFAGPVRLNGLVIRRRAEAAMYAGG